MDHDRFDSLTRTIRSRRAVSGAITSTVAGLLGLTRAREAVAAPCPKGKRRCGEKCVPKGGCCKTADCRPVKAGKVCRQQRCVCPAGKKPCGKRCLLKAAACPPKPDAFCLPTGTPPIIFLDVRAAQTFIESNGGRLFTVILGLRNQPATFTGTYELRLQTVDPATGIPLPTTLGLTQRAAADVSDTELVPVRFDFPVPVPLKPRRRYALMLALGNGANVWRMEAGDPDLCPGTEFFTESPIGSGIFISQPSLRFAFQTIVKD